MKENHNENVLNISDFSSPNGSCNIESDENNEQNSTNSNSNKIIDKSNESNMLNNFNPQLKNNIEIQENNDQNKILSLKHSPSFDSLDSDFDTDLNFSESSSSSKSSSSSENEFEKLHKANQNQNNNNISEIEENSENKYAVEDNIDPSKFDTIENLAINYPFTLDNFQKKSIYRLERNENVLVCAHTSSGKTVVAEYGIALGKKKSKRVIYTSPIKALSNQKYREFKKLFGDVGILTGDVNINPNAQCLIMTTEILQNFLYKNNEIISQVAFIIFDEIHYINDNERGHVWEEILILLPSGINLIMLSATIPNYMNFAKWVGRIKNTIIYVEITLQRVVPLKHQIFLNNQCIFEVKGIDGNIKVNEIKKALNTLKEINTSKILKPNKATEQLLYNNIQHMDKKNFEKFQKDPKFAKKFEEKNIINNILSNNGYDKNKIRITKMHHKLDEVVDYLTKKDLCPAVIFVFSIKRIKEYSKMLNTKNLLNKEEQKQVETFFNKVIYSTMPPDDLEMPQVMEVQEILKSGIGLHHAGLLPILKEIIEILYSKGLIKVLFATTSFSIGLNMPTRTVIFTDLYKFNEDKKEILSSSEYLQMCGRAGRRGIDSIGNVFIILTEITNKNEDSDIIKMLGGEGTDVKSKFRFSYKILLSFLSHDLKTMKVFFEESFLESDKILSLPLKTKEKIFLDEKIKKYKGKIKCIYDEDKIKSHNFLSQMTFKQFLKEEKEPETKIEKKEMDIEDLPICDLYNSYDKFRKLNKKFFSIEKINIYLKKHSGSIIKVRSQKLHKNIFVMLINGFKNKNKLCEKIWCLGIKKFYKNIVEEDNDDIPEDMIINDDIQIKDRDIYKGYKYFYEMFNNEDIIEIYENIHIEGTGGKTLKESTIKINGKRYFKLGNNFFHILKQLYTKLTQEFTNENVVQKLNFKKFLEKNCPKNFEYIKESIQRNKIIENQYNSLCYKCKYNKEHIKILIKYTNAKKKIKQIEEELKPENMEYYNEFNMRIKLLKEMKYINEDNTLTLKGQAAREICSADCVIISEILTSDIMTNLKDEDAVAFLSGFLSNKNLIDETDPKINDDLSKAYEKFREILENITNNEKEKDFEESKYNRRFVSEMTNAMRSWMMGDNFGEICILNDIEEGKLHNLILRMFLFLEEIKNFYMVLGNVDQSNRYKDIKTKLLRGIMGVQSLYVQDKVSIEVNK